MKLLVHRWDLLNKRRNRAPENLRVFRVAHQNVVRRLCYVPALPQGRVALNPERCRHPGQELEAFRFGLKQRQGDPRGGKVHRAVLVVLLALLDTPIVHCENGQRERRSKILQDPGRCLDSVRIKPLPQNAKVLQPVHVRGADGIGFPIAVMVDFVSKRKTATANESRRLDQGRFPQQIIALNRRMRQLQPRRTLLFVLHETSVTENTRNEKLSLRLSVHQTTHFAPVQALLRLRPFRSL